MRRIIIICCFIVLCAGVVLAGSSVSPSVEQGSPEASRPIAQAESGAGFLVEFSTMGLLGVGSVSLFVCRKRKRL